jgi:hypothetical protein
MEHLWCVRLTTSLETSIGFGIDTICRARLHLDDILTSWDNSIFINSILSNNQPILEIQIWVTHDKNVLISYVPDKFEVVTSVPVISFLNNLNALHWWLSQFHSSSLIL